MTRDERADIEDAISELLVWGGSDRYRRESCDIAVAAMREKLAALAPEGATPAPDDCACGDGSTLRGYIATYGETPAMTAGNREHWKRRAEIAEAALAAAAPAPAAGQCATCGERDGAHGDWCHTRACVNCGHGIAQHREGLAVRLLSDGHFHPCPGYGAEKGGTRCSFVHEEGWTCGRDQGHPSVHVPPSRMETPE